MTPPTSTAPPPPFSSNRFAWRVLRADPRAYGMSLLLWVTFFSAPLVTGLLARTVLDRVAPGAGGPVTLLLVVIAAVEVARWVLLGGAIVQWHGVWVLWH